MKALVELQAKFLELFRAKNKLKNDEFKKLHHDLLKESKKLEFNEHMKFKEWSENLIAYQDYIIERVKGLGEKRMNERKLYIETNKSLTYEDLQVLSEIIYIQNTTDKDEIGEYVLDGVYFYKIDDNYNVILTDIRR